MILDPGILALLVSSLLGTLMVLFAAGYGVQVLRHWDITSGSELQLSLERRTYLISTVVRYFLFFQLLSLFLYVRTADSICHLFVGAMCAVGTLTANPLGYPTLMLKLLTFFLAGFWLIINHADDQGYDYPLIRPKYLLLVLLAPLILTETLLQGLYFLRLRPDIITSCCGSLFSRNAPGMVAEVASLPALPMLAVFYLSALVTLGCGLIFVLRGQGGYPFAAVSGVNFAVALVAIVSSLSLYFYELPSHHCPFCLLQKEYGYLGYPLYLLILCATVTGGGVGVLHPFRDLASLRGTLPSLQRRLASISLVSLASFTAVVTWRVITSSLSLRGY